MNKRDRQIQIFLQLFYLIAGLYLAGLNIWKLNAELWPEGIFESYNGSIPIFTLAAGFIGGILSLITSLFLWTRVSWAHGLSLFTPQRKSSTSAVKAVDEATPTCLVAAFGGGVRFLWQ